MLSSVVRRVLLASLALASLTLACADAAEQSTDSLSSKAAPREVAAPVFEIELWPGEGIPVVEAVAAELPLRAAPSDTAAVVDTLRAGADRRILYDSTRYRTLESARVRVAAPASIRGRYLGDIRYLSRRQYYGRGFRDTTIAVTPSTRVELLQHRAEGSCFVQVGGGVVDANPCPTLDTASFQSEAEPVTRWWIHVPTPSRSGWLLLSDSTARVTTRTF